MKTVTIESKEYPMRASLGAMRMFKAETGREISEVKEYEISEFGVFLYCCVAAECRRRRIEFAMSLDDFCDSMDPEALASLSEEAREEANPTEDGSGEKGAKKK